MKIKITVHGVWIRMHGIMESLWKEKVLICLVHIHSDEVLNVVKLYPVASKLPIAYIM